MLVLKACSPFGDLNLTTNPTILSLSLSLSLSLGEQEGIRMIFEEVAGLRMFFDEAAGLLVFSVNIVEERCTDKKSVCYGGVRRLRLQS